MISELLKRKKILVFELTSYYYKMFFLHSTVPAQVIKVKLVFL